MNHPAYLEFENATSRILVEEIYNPLHQMVHVTFEDGYENVFFSDVETGEWMEQDLGFTSLASAVGRLIWGDDFQKKRPTRKLVWYHENAGRKPLHFGFLKYRSSGDIFYAIFASNKRYMFTLFKNKHLWKVLSHINLHSWNFDLDYFQEVPFLLDMYKL